MVEYSIQSTVSISIVLVKQMLSPGRDWPWHASTHEFALSSAHLENLARNSLAAARFLRVG